MESVRWSSKALNVSFKELTGRQLDVMHAIAVSTLTVLRLLISATLRWKRYWSHMIEELEK